MTDIASPTPRPTDHDPLAGFRRWAQTPARHPSLTVVVPAYDEEARIIPTIGAIAAHVCATYGTDWELVVADDGSTDRTPQMLAGLDLANLVVRRAHVNAGKGDAVRRGLAAARGRAVLFADADQSTPIEQLGMLLDRLDAGADVVIASRAVDGAQEQHKPALRRLVSGLSRLTVRVGLGLPFADTQCGFKLYTAQAAAALASVQQEDGFAFDLEHLFVARRAGMRIEEVGVEWIDAPGSKVDPVKEIRRFLAAIVRIRLNGLTGRYARV